MSDDIGQDRPESGRKRVKKTRESSVIKTLPNILLSGTPGTGKSTLAKRIAEETSMTWINVGDFAKEKGFLGAWDEEYECHELEEDPLLDELEELVAKGGCIVDHHVTDFFPERYFDIVFIMRTENDQLYERLSKRGYKGKKFEDNLQCEIFQTVLEEARESYREEIVHELRSDVEADIESNLARIKSWIEQWKLQNVH
jgi:adenylate kinase